MIGSTLVGAVEIIAGLGWDPEIRGLLTVVLAMAILAGSVWLLLVTNTGTRLGSLIALAGFWGWMFVMGIFWWIYGIGWAGSLPSWEVEDVFIDPSGIEQEGLQQAFVGNVSLLPDSNCFARDSFPPVDGVASVSLDPTDNLWALCTPRAIETLMAYPGTDRESIVQELLNPQSEESKITAIATELFSDVEMPRSDVTGDVAVRTCPGSIEALAEAAKVCVDGSGLTELELLEIRSTSEREAIFGELVARREGEIAQAAMDANQALEGDPRFLDEAGLQAKIAEDTANAMLRIDDFSLSQLEALAPQVNEWAEEEGLIRLKAGWVLQSTSQAGEATATADAFLREELFPDGNFLVLDAFQEGGKDKRDGADLWTRISHKFSSTVQITHPTNYTVVTVQQTLDKPVDPSKPPPVPEINSEEPTYSVVMIRNLGNLRLIPALFTIFTFILFVLTCLVLHWRDLGMRDKGIEV